MIKGIHVLLFFLGFLAFISCAELFNKECRVTGAYKEYEFTQGYEEVAGFAILNSNLYELDTCSQYTTRNGCGIIIKTIDFFNELVADSEISIQVSDSSLLDFDDRILVGFKTETDWGTRVYDSVFIGYNSVKKELFIRCQYELSHQCAGSEIDNLFLQKLISIPKISEVNSVVFSIENVNPL